MSRSRVYRPIQLSIEEIAEISSRIKHHRLATVQARLQAEALCTVEARFERDAIPAARQSGQGFETVPQVTHEVSSPLRAPALASAIPILPDSATLSDVSGERSIAPDHGSELRALGFELEEIERTASELGIALKGGMDARHALATARAFAGLGTTPTGLALDRLRAAIEDVDGELTSAFIDAEAKARTLAGAIRTLEAIGFHAVRSTTDGDAIVISATTSRGQEASIEICSDAIASVGLTVTVVDPATAVPLSHVAAGDVCDQAVLTQAEIQRALQRLPGLAAGPITAVGKPTRGGSEGPREELTRHAAKNNRSMGR